MLGVPLEGQLALSLGEQPVRVPRGPLIFRGAPRVEPAEVPVAPQTAHPQVRRAQPPPMAGPGPPRVLPRRPAATPSALLAEPQPRVDQVGLPSRHRRGAVRVQPRLLQAPQGALPRTPRLPKGPLLLAQEPGHPPALEHPRGRPQVLGGPPLSRHRARLCRVGPRAWPLAPAPTVVETASRQELVGPRRRARSCGLGPRPPVRPRRCAAKWPGAPRWSDLRMRPGGRYERGYPH